MLCPLGHSLQSFQTTTEGWTCSVCLRVVGIKSTLYGCRTCDFDVCVPCSTHEFSGARKEFDGRWVTSVGQEVSITGPCIKGSLSVFRSEADGQCSMEIQGIRYFGKLSGDSRIEWDDGDVWLRESEGPRAAGIAQTSGPDFSDVSAAASSSSAFNRAPPPPASAESCAAAPAGRPLTLPSAPPPAAEVAPPPMPVLREKHEVSPQWAVIGEDEHRSSAARIPNPPSSLPPPPSTSELDPDAEANDRV
jgi:hypothetical protein